MVAGGGLGALVGMAALWLRYGADSGDASRDPGMVRIEAGAPAAADPAHLFTPAAIVELPALPGQIVAQVKKAYPLLTDVAFRCAAKGCAVTATIPPPTDDAFLEKRQEMLLGGLARTLETMGYAAEGPVQMEEESENLYHIRLPARPARPRG
ncbi:hypothetical protein A7X12_05375 [Sphingomonas sp. TDK1]|nr:hypothetical protein A7X12_05375 [Sphingomonas sp. TDK1]